MPPASMPKIYEALGSSEKTMHWIERSDHVMTVDVSAEEVFQAASKFIMGLNE